MKSYYLGIDIGGTKIAISIGHDDGEILISDRIPTLPAEDSSIGIERTIDMIHILLKKIKINIEDIKAIGIACPGPISVKEGKLLAPINLPGWRNVEIAKIFKEKLGRPVFMNHDAKACALAEFTFGKRKNVENLIYLTMSTGVGGGIIANGHIVQGATDSAGEIGHCILDINGPRCVCGQYGCLEAFCGGARVAMRLREEIASSHIKTAILDEVGGDIHKIDFVAFVNAVKKGDPYALQMWDEFVIRLAQGIGILLMMLNPDAIILGTIAVHAGDLLFVPLKKAIARYSWQQPHKACLIEASALKEKMGELSSLALAINGSDKL
ncbi:MAG: ROK family protein [Parachlamydiales bacterium]|nr:ROK family protein [Parachlamydiales bacterium]